MNSKNTDALKDVLLSGRDRLVGNYELKTLLIEGLDAVIRLATADIAAGRSISPKRQESVDKIRAILKAQFHPLNVQTLVFTAAELEATLDDFLLKLLLCEPVLLTLPQLADVKVPLATFQALDDEQRIRCLLSEYERGKAIYGFSRFEFLLGAVGLSGPIPANIRLSIIEMYASRNVLLHNKGIIDEKFVKACPKRAGELGEPIQITHDQLKRYFSATGDYLQLLYERVDHYDPAAFVSSQSKKAEKSKK